MSTDSTKHDVSTVCQRLCLLFIKLIAKIQNMIPRFCCQRKYGVKSVGSSIYVGKFIVSFFWSIVRKFFFPPPWKQSQANNTLLAFLFCEPELSGIWKFRIKIRIDLETTKNIYRKYIFYHRLVRPSLALSLAAWVFTHKFLFIQNNATNKHLL